MQDEGDGELCAEVRGQRGQGRVSRALAVALALVVVAGSCAALVASWAGGSGDATVGASDDGVTLLSFDGAYRVDDGAWRPLDGPRFEAPLVGLQSVTVKGSLSEDVPAGERVNLRLSSTSCTVRVNGATVFSFDGRSGEGPAGEPMLGWVGFSSPGITADDEVEIALERVALWSSFGDFELTFRTLCAGDADSLRHAMIGLFAPMFVCGAAVLMAGVLLLLVASVGHLMGVPKERGSVLFALYVLLGGVWIFFCFDYITLLVPRPQFTATVSLLAQDALALVLIGFVVQRSQGGLRRFARAILMVLAGIEAAAVLLRLSGVCSLFDANAFIVPVFELSLLTVAAVFCCRAFATRDREMGRTVVVVLPCAAGAFLEGLSFLAWGVSTGFALTAGIAVSVIVRLVALYAHARQQVALAERARRAEQELAKSRVSVALSQIQPHFLYNALAVISGLCTEDPPLAARTVNDFACYLRGNMDSLVDGRLISLERELEHLRHYVAIEQLRFPRIAVVLETGGSDCRIPALTVQPLVENAIRHGLRGRAEGGTVTVTSWRDGEGCHVRVADDGFGFPCVTDVADVARAPGGVARGGDPARSHVGLANVAYRVRTLCGGTVSVLSRPGEGCVVTVTLPDEQSDGAGGGAQQAL